MKKKCIAEFVKWNGEIVKCEIQREWAQDIADAVAGQFTFINNTSGFMIKGSDFAHVDVYEVAA